ncbi:phosphoglucomutase, alpha-D-glucose phosphate-specific [Malonomonas rubra DSM 5091]|uniref:Phosphoglucomutase, alpha-D-glucose phosphate-specific n=1 Tax=Malonomonas rubra DSM 5091 TaxID=1122189 RepID=A0A1M6BIM9_MALRU|nr:phosphoglucomutase/phosphomannomutase family protein [Malonomonas rubra]SHI48571.1 phosphoglucomutase, alpha-D-glucose phosphate-specific [Malonomonas rubra DSM 5091]
MSQIKFGTSGWRGILCEDFTLNNVRVVTQAIADHLQAEGLADAGLVIGYDARFMGADFARETARVLAGAGIKSFFCIRDTPTPVIAHELLRRKASGAINFTASHNPYDYNGIKFSPAWGGPALPETTGDIEKRANEMLDEIVYKEITLTQAKEKGLFEEINPREEYFKTLRKLIDFDAIAASGMKLAVNPLYGSGRDYLDTILEEAGVPVVKVNDHLDPYFGGEPPEPAEAHIPDFIELIKNDDSIALGIATDGDADRFGIVDGDGSYIEPNYILALLFDYMIRTKKMKGNAARSVATSHLIDAVAKYHGVEVLETPVGFKYIGEYISEDKILIGGEESAGLSICGHVPEKDGILACLLVAEMVAVEKKSLRELLADLYSRVGEIYTKRINIRLSPQLEASLPAKLQNPPHEIGGNTIEQVIKIDGNKFLFDDGSWMLFRKSGTEPVVRLYGEAGTAERLAEVMAQGQAFILGE